MENFFYYSGVALWIAIGVATLLFLGLVLVAMSIPNDVNKND